MSLVHRLPAGVKIAALTLGSLAIFFVSTLGGVAIAIALVGAGYALARLHPRHLWAQVRPVMLIVAVLFGVQWWAIGFEPAAVLAIRIATLVALAGLVTLTSRTADLLDAIGCAIRPLRRIGVDSERVALVLSLAIRGIPVLADVSHQVQEAQRARGRRDVRAYAVPVVVGALRRADAVSEALAARGLDDECQVRSQVPGHGPG